MRDLSFFKFTNFKRHQLNCIMSEWVDIIPVSTCSSSADKLFSCSSWPGKKHWLSLGSHLCGFCGFHFYQHSSPSFEWADVPGFNAGKNPHPIFKMFQCMGGAIKGDVWLYFFFPPIILT